MFGKEFYKSKSFWFFLLYLVVNVAALFGYADFVPGEAEAQIVGVVVSIVGIVLRFVTKETITL